MYVALNGNAPAAGALVDLEYTGDTPISGPSRVEIPKNDHHKYFDATVSPCSIQPTCISVIKARYHGGQVQASVTIDQ